MLYPLQNISHVLIRILFPAFSQIQNDNKKFKKAYLRVIFFIALISFPIMAGLIGTADIFVNVVLGNKWEGLTVILIILAPVGMIQSVQTTLGSIFMAKGNTQKLFRIGSINSIVTVVFFAIGTTFGVEGVAISYLISTLIMLYPNLLIAWRQIDLTVAEGLKEIKILFIISIFLALGIYLFGLSIETLITNDLVRLSLMILFGATFYYILIRLKYVSLLVMLKELKR